MSTTSSAWYYERFICNYVNNDIYSDGMKSTDKPLVWLYGEIRTPPFSSSARIEAGYLLRLLQSGMMLELPHSRPMPTIGTRCHELRINDKTITWRIVYRIDHDAIIILEIFRKKSQKTPTEVIRNCQRRLRLYDLETME